MKEKGDDGKDMHYQNRKSLGVAGREAGAILFIVRARTGRVGRRGL